MDVEESEEGQREAPAPVAEASAPKRSRGRPRKPAQEPVEPPGPKRPRGRPKGSKNKGQRITAKAEPTRERRPRGRPRKWPQKTVHQEEQQSAHPEVKGAGSAEDQPIQTPPSASPPQESV